MLPPVAPAPGPEAAPAHVPPLFRFAPRCSGAVPPNEVDDEDVAGAAPAPLLGLGPSCS